MQAGRQNTTHSLGMTSPSAVLQRRLVPARAGEYSTVVTLLLPSEYSTVVTLL